MNFPPPRRRSASRPDRDRPEDDDDTPPPPSSSALAAADKRSLEIYAALPVETRLAMLERDALRRQDRFIDALEANTAATNHFGETLERVAIGIEKRSPPTVRRLNPKEWAIVIGAIGLLATQVAQVFRPPATFPPPIASTPPAATPSR